MISKKKRKEVVQENEDSFSVSTQEEANALERLNGTDWITTLAIAIHNIPQGMAIFVTFISQFNLGLALSISLAIHNVAVGLCIAFPIVFQSGRTITAFKMAGIAGLAVPLGSILAYALLGTSFLNHRSLTFGIAHAVISGMMTCISLRDFIPAAIKYEKNSNGLSFVGTLVGMLVISVSLLLTRL